MRSLIIRHCVEESNIDENLVVIDAKKTRHVRVRGGAIESMSGLIDPASHLNLDFPDHKITTCVIAEKFHIRSKIRISDEGMVFAIVRRSSCDHYGKVDYTKRLAMMVRAVNKLKSKRSKNENIQNRQKGKAK